MDEKNKDLETHKDDLASGASPEKLPESQSYVKPEPTAAGEVHTPPVEPQVAKDIPVEAVHSAEGITPEGEPFATATKEEAEASSTHAFFDAAASEAPKEPSNTGGNNVIPPVPPTRASGGGTGSEPPKKGKKTMLGVFLAGLIGVLIGALIVLGFSWGALHDDNNTASNSTTTSSGQTKKVTVENTTSTTQAVEKVQDAVVSVLNYQAGTSISTGGTTEDEASSGSGVVYKKSGGKAYIVTNNHVVEGANKLEVTFSNGKKSEATLVGTDKWNDLAVLEISDKNVTTVAEFGNSDSLKVGETAIAIGSPLGTEFAGTVTEGIISGLNRTVPVDTNGDGTEDWEAEVIQTDAAINPGNSGGALVNIEGQVIGINSMKISTENVEGIGFAIPSNTVEPIIDQLEKNGEVERPSLGVTLRDVDTIPEVQQQQILKLPEGVDYGAMVQQVVSGSAADKAGLKEYDVIVEMNGKKVTNSMTLRQILYASDVKVGDKMEVKYYRSGKKETTTVTLTAASSTNQ
ncbi:putative heat-shock protein htrA serine protease [Listeria weihenstephanensis FSL R9-0317]|uniref:PDZ domain-containing protein n=1 Tax=Listeria weihenstephanensis TaxID=1006155 RepID=A0A1S7FXG1_9LIST|nr:trypsin-like peptidase domain-containing protein [Listeria weihenstephanensis]AQY52124.1 serine protease [Listeria weihenstephanensis]EUJ37665.1 putative heat-shock protein htrA serine protease [Listeria weihenstephanensis FSL R9-0317]MBC1500911.1 PDZ domain-containing protein [Listeria weihenstephanensis]